MQNTQQIKVCRFGVHNKQNLEHHTPLRRVFLCELNASDEGHILSAEKLFIFKKNCTKNKRKKCHNSHTTLLHEHQGMLAHTQRKTSRFQPACYTRVTHGTDAWDAAQPKGRYKWDASNKTKTGIQPYNLLTLLLTVELPWGRTPFACSIFIFTSLSAATYVTLDESICIVRVFGI